MNCWNCGFKNGPDDEFCGNCGKYLKFSGAQDDDVSAGLGSGARAPARLGRVRALQLAAGRRRQRVERRPAQPARVVPEPRPGQRERTTRRRYSPPGVRGQAVLAPRQGCGRGSWLGGGWRTTGPVGQAPDIICWNCGRRNPASRTFCLNCGQRLTAPDGSGAGFAGAGAGAAAGGAAVLTAGRVAGRAMTTAVAAAVEPQPSSSARSLCCSFLASWARWRWVSSEVDRQGPSGSSLHRPDRDCSHRRRR